MGRAFSRDNHYVPQAYLKRWASPDQKVWVYRTLASHASVPQWRTHSIKGIGYLQHLYSRTAHGTESDAVERWLADEVDGPIEGVLAKVAAETRLTPGDWDALMRFFAAAWCRTLAWYMRRQQQWGRELSPRINQVMKDTVAKLEAGTAALAPNRPDGQSTEGFELPMRVRMRENPAGEGGLMETEVLAGRGLWFFEMRRIVEHTWKRLHTLHWTILRPPAGALWFTSDDPAVVANISADRNVTFNGGWTVPGTVLLLPLDPEHVLYGKLERPLPSKYAEASASDAEFVRNCVARNSHRMVFSREKDDWVPTVRPRREDAKAFEDERNELDRWHTSQTKAEAALEDESTWPTPGGPPA